jgi:hypothetical protein
VVSEQLWSAAPGSAGREKLRQWPAREICRVRAFGARRDHGARVFVAVFLPFAGPRLDLEVAAELVARASAAYAGGDWETCDGLVTEGRHACGEIFTRFVEHVVSPALSYRVDDPAWEACPCSRLTRPLRPCVPGAWKPPAPRTPQRRASSPRSPCSTPGVGEQNKVGEGLRLAGDPSTTHQVPRSRHRIPSRSRLSLPALCPALRVLARHSRDGPARGRAGPDQPCLTASLGNPHGCRSMRSALSLVRVGLEIGRAHV